MGKTEVEEMSDDNFMNSTKVNNSLTGINSSNSLSLDISVTRSGNVFIKKVKVECSTQTVACKEDRPKLRIALMLLNPYALNYLPFVVYL